MGLNRLLLDFDRKKFEELIEKMRKVSPEMMSRKIARANVQQAFILNAVLNELEDKKHASILCVGSFEDTVADYLKQSGHKIVEIDPDINVSLEEFYATTDKRFDIVFATSVIEHVQDDEKFLNCFCGMLKSKGIGIITCDYNDNYKSGDEVPATVIRQLTKQDLSVRYNNIIRENNCRLVGVPDWDGTPDFQLDSKFTYCFASFVFRKK